MDDLGIRNRDGRLAGRFVPRGTKLKKGEYFLAVAVVVRAGEKWLVTRRAPGKTAPLLWEFPGGGVQAGEKAKRPPGVSCKKKRASARRPRHFAAKGAWPFPKKTC